MIIDNLNNQIVEAMKAHDEVRVSTLKLLSAEIHNFQIDHPNMTNEEELDVVKKEAKKRRDAIESYLKAGLQDKADTEVNELKILKEFLPAELTDQELQQFVDEAIAESGAKDIKDMGKVMSLVREKSKGNADGARVSIIVKQKLSI
ncbi:MAG TPA: GatB/YqeY domain-containing protein [Patescibacteria group bacterium]|nr:GatB/YqeY domain-containing protein [Patescibacteria group bacterium]